MKKQKFMKLSAFTSDPELGNSFSAPATHDGEVSVVFRDKDISIHGWDGSAWTTIYTWNGLDKQFTFNNTYQNYFLKSLTGSQETMGVSFFSTSRYQGSTPSLAGIDRDVKFHDVDEVPIYTASDENKMLTVMSDGSLAWLGLNESYVVEVIGTGDEGDGGGNVIAGTFIEELTSASNNLSNGALITNNVFVKPDNASVTLVSLDTDGIVDFNVDGTRTEEEMTLSMWFNPDSTSWTGWKYIAGNAADSNNEFRLAISKDGSGNIEFKTILWDLWTGSPKGISSKPFVAGEWTHLAMTWSYNGSTYDLKLFVDGVKCGELLNQNRNLMKMASNRNFALGALAFGGSVTGSSLPCSIDSVQIKSGTALTDSQVAAIAGQSDRQMSIETAAQPSGGGPSSFAEEVLDVSSLVGDASLVDDGGNKIFQNFPAGSSTPGYALTNWSDYITYNSTSSQFEYTTMAVSFWFKLDSEISSTGQGNGYSVIGDKSSADGFHMFIFNSGTTHELYLGYRKPGNGGATKQIMNTSNGAGNSFVNGWNHALVVFHGDQVTFDLYANGSFVRTVTDADAGSSFIGDVTNQNSQFAIGAKDSSGASARGFLVETDSLEIVQDVTLTEAQVSQIAADSTRQTSINDV